MSKKMMKRSLALGALMAFVITGQVWAETLEQFNGKYLTVLNQTAITTSIENRYISDATNFIEVKDNAILVEECTLNQPVYNIKVVSVPRGEVIGNSAKIVNSVLDKDLYSVHAVFQSTTSDCIVTVENNDLEVNSSQIGNVYGAYVSGYSKDGKLSVIVKDNRVVIDGNSVVSGNIYGAYAAPRLNNAKEIGNVECNLINNTVTIINGTINGDVYGGYVKPYQRHEVDTSVVSNNKVELVGGIVSGNVYAGYSATHQGWEANPDNPNCPLLDDNGNAIEKHDPEPASNNTISLQGDVDVSNAKLYGNNGGEGTGNKLEVDESYSGDGKINTVGAFDEIEIDEMQYGEAALDVENMNYKEADAQGKGGTKLTVNKMTMSGDQELTGELEIIKATNSNLKDENNQNKGAISDESSVTIYKGTSEIIEVGFGGDTGTTITEENITRTTRNDQVLVIGESRAAATAFVNQGSELVETGLDAIARDNAKAGDTKAFAAVYGNASEYATGSHVKVNGWSGIVGVGKTNANGLTVGAFFENGTGNYRTYNTVNNDFMRGDGEATYNGGGFLVRKDNANGVYTEASLRAGNLQNELRKAVRGSEGLTGYDVDTFYYGAHVGVGKIIPRGNEGDSIDVYGKFIYTHHDSENFEIDGSDFHFDSVDSERLRLGFRINEVQSNKLSMYYGAAWEYEFGGDADNTTVGYDLSTPSLGGSTMIGEIGMHYLASEKWSLDLNVRGYSGQRDGFTGSVQANYNF